MHALNLNHRRELKKHVEALESCLKAAQQEDVRGALLATEARAKQVRVCVCAFACVCARVHACVRCACVC